MKLNIKFVFVAFRSYTKLSQISIKYVVLHIVTLAYIFHQVMFAQVIVCFNNYVKSNLICNSSVNFSTC